MMIKYIVIILCFHQLAAKVTTRPNRLISYALPDKRHLKEALGFYEDTYLNFTEITTKYGYPSEEHTITTEDGYLLTVFRILSKCKQRRGAPAILGHGIFDSSDAWIITGPETGLAYILSNKCYDVWAVNFRGNTYSRKHVRLDPNKDPDYWEFTFDETGNFDLPAIIDYVLQITGQSQVNYIGHSQGCTDFIIMGSLRPEYNKKIRLSIQLAPVVWMKNVQIPVASLLAREGDKIKEILYNIGFRELFAKQQFLHALTELLCQYFPQAVCGTSFAIFTGYVYGSITSKNFAVIMGHLFVGMSVKTISHFGQLLVSGNFQRYDEGRERNIERYGTITPPTYNVSRITHPVVIVGAKNDYLSTIKDLNILSSKLPYLVEKYIVPVPTWSHNNHLWGVNAPKYVFPKILTYFDKFNT